MRITIKGTKQDGGDEVEYTTDATSVDDAKAAANAKGVLVTKASTVPEPSDGKVLMEFPPRHELSYATPEPKTSGRYRENKALAILGIMTSATAIAFLAADLFGRYVHLTNSTSREMLPVGSFYLGIFAIVMSSLAIVRRRTVLELLSMALTIIWLIAFTRVLK